MTLFQKLTLLASLTLITGYASAQSNEKKNPDEDKMVAAWMAYMTPGERHKQLANDNGIWSAEVTMWMSPGATPQTTKGTCENTMILGGRYQQSVNRMNWNGMPFEGISTTGYDNALKKHISTWIDNFGTGIMYLEGTYDAKSNTINFSGKMVEPISGKSVPVRETMTFIDDNNSVMEMFITDNGKEYKSMNIKFTRNH